jgi:putative methyltransferase
MKNIYLVQVVDSYGPNKFLPLAISYQWLAALQNPVVADQWKLQDVLIEKKDIEEWLNNLGSVPNLVAMSCYVWNWEYNRALATEIKKRWPSCTIVLGGPQVSKHDPSFIRNNTWADVAVLGENESALEIVLTTPKSEWHRITGVIVDSTVEILQPERTINISQLPSPILTGFYNWIIDRYQSRHCDKILWQVTYETMRGCPYHCQFCDIGDRYWNKTYFFNLERIKKEIEWMGQNKIEYVSVCDSNWGMFEHDVEITQWVIDTKLKYGYPQFWDVTWAKNNSARVQKIALMDHAAGTKLFKGITFAFQSFNNNTLQAVKRFNLQDATVRSSLETYKNNNIPTYSELIWPMPNETLQSLKNNLQCLVDLGQRDFVMVHPLVLTPNSDMGQPEYIQQHGLKTKNVCLDTFWLKLDNEDTYIREKVDAVYATNTVSYQDVVAGNMFAYWFIVLYYYGWANTVIEYLVKKFTKTHTDIVDDFIGWVNKSSGFMWQEHIKTLNGFCEVFDSNGIWGRQLAPGDVYWEYKSATSVQFHHNRDLVNQELALWLHDSYGIVYDELIDLNSSMCFNWQNNYPIKKTFPKNLIKTCLGLDAELLKFDHWDQDVVSHDQFCKVAYHYQRKNRYWKCQVTAVE